MAADSKEDDLILLCRSLCWLWSRRLLLLGARKLHSVQIHVFPIHVIFGLLRLNSSGLRCSLFLPGPPCLLCCFPGFLLLQMF